MAQVRPHHEAQPNHEAQARPHHDGGTGRHEWPHNQMPQQPPDSRTVMASPASASAASGWDYFREDCQRHLPGAHQVRDHWRKQQARSHLGPKHHKQVNHVKAWVPAYNSEHTHRCHMLAGTAHQSDHTGCPKMRRMCCNLDRAVATISHPNVTMQQTQALRKSRLATLGTAPIEQQHYLAPTSERS